MKLLLNEPIFGLLSKHLLCFEPWSAFWVPHHTTEAGILLLKELGEFFSHSPDSRSRELIRAPNILTRKIKIVRVGAHCRSPR